MSDQTQAPGLDPRPVFSGDWASATGQERQAHMVLVNAWKARQPGGDGDAQSRMGAGSAPPATSATTLPTGDAATRAVLVAIRDDASAHDSDRIRAASALIALDRERDATQGSGPSPLRALAEVLTLIAPEERLAWLQGERLEHMQAAGSGQSG
jgi:hypothetical protein